MFKHILVPLDRSSLAECVSPHVARLAKAFDARVTLLHVAEPPAEADDDSVDPIRWQMLQAEREAYLESAAADLESHGIRVDWELLEGSAAESILTYIDNDTVDLIIVSSHGRSGLNRWNVSSVAQKIVMHAGTSVLLIRAYKADAASTDAPPKRYRRILVPLDGSQRAECVISAVETLSRDSDTTVLLAHIVHKPQMPRRSRLTEEERTLYQKVSERNSAAAAAYLEDMQEHISGPVEIRLIDGENVTVSLHQLVEQEQADLVVLSAHGFTGVRRWPYGAITTSFIIYGAVPLLIVQDIPRDQIQPSEAELAAREVQGH